MTDTNRLKGAIAAAGLTQAAVAEKIGLSPTALNNKITNKSSFKADEIQKLTQLLKLTREETDRIFFAVKVD